MHYIVILVILILLAILIKRLVQEMKPAVTDFYHQYKIWIIAFLAFFLTIFFTTQMLLVYIAVAVYMFRRYYLREKRVSEMENIATGPLTIQILEQNAQNLADLFERNDSNAEDHKFIKNFPYGRVTAFLNYFDLDENEEIYYFSVKPSLNEDELREYGIAVTLTGIYIAYQPDESYAIKIQIPFSGLHSVNLYQNGQIGIVHVVREGCGYEFSTLPQNILQISSEALLNGISSVCDSELASALFKEEMKSDVPEESGMAAYAKNTLDQAQQQFDKYNQMESLNRNMSNVGTMAAASERQNSFNENGSLMNGINGHGYAAEYASKTFDQMLGKKVEGQEIDINGKKILDGADKIVNGQKIQIKYCKTASETYYNAFKDSNHDYISKNQSVEVPKDQYNEIKAKLQEDINKGVYKDKGIEPGTPAEKYLKKGYFDYKTSYRFAAAGNIQSISLDIVQGAIISSYGASIAGICVFARVIWSGGDLKSAAKSSLKVSGKVLLKSSVIYTVRMQANRKYLFNKLPETNNNGATNRINPIYKVSQEIGKKINTSSLAKSSFGKKIHLDKVSGESLVNGTITVAVVVGPDICRACRGKISAKQLAKNASIGAAGVAGGVVGEAIGTTLGAATGPLAGFMGAVGGMVGGTVAGAMAKSVADRVVEDDAVSLFRIVKEEFLDIVMTSYLTQDEFNEVADKTVYNKKKMSKELQNMYKASKKGEERQYAYDLINNVVLEVLQKRPVITNEMIEQGFGSIA